MVRPTIPFASETLEFEGGNSVQAASPLSIELSSPDKSSTCNLGKANCAINIDSYNYDHRDRYENPDNWKKIYSTRIFNTDDEQYYVPNHKLVLRLSTNDVHGQGGKIFAGATFPDVHVSNQL